MDSSIMIPRVSHVISMDRHASELFFPQQQLHSSYTEARDLGPVEVELSSWNFNEISKVTVEI